MMGESITERINRLTAERQRPANPPPSQVAAAEPLDKDEQRRARTHRLVQIGALTDQYLGSSGLSPEEVGELLARIASMQQVRDLIP